MNHLERVSGDYEMILDGMAYVQQSQVTDKSSLPVQKLQAKRIDAVFDVYRNLSIKNVERNRRTKGQLLLKNHHCYAINKIMEIISFLEQTQKFFCGILCLTVEKR